MLCNRSFVLLVAAMGMSCSKVSSPDKQDADWVVPDGFDQCDPEAIGDGQEDGSTYLVRIDVGRTEEDDDGEDDDELDEKVEKGRVRDNGEFVLDRPYDEATGYGHVGSSGEVLQDPGWTVWAWPFGGRSDPRIHLATRTGFGGYRFDVENGLYAITWHFIEKHEHWSGFRKMDLIAEKRVAVEGYDIFEEVGNRFMVTARALARVSDGHLDVELKSKGTKAPAILSALEVEAIAPDTEPPGDVEDMEIRGGYGQVILTWTPGREKDLRGVNLWRSETRDGPWTRANPRVVTGRHFTDQGLESGRSYFYTVVAQDLFCNDSPGVTAGPVTVREHGESRLPVFEIEILDAALIGLTEDVSQDLYVPAVLFIDGAELPIEIRNRGASTRYLSKQNYKIRLLGGLEHNGRNGFKLNSEVVDPMMITEKLSYDLFNLTDAVAPVARYVHLTLNGRYMGVYTEVQEVDRRFLVDKGIDEDGNLYRLGAGLLNILPDPEYAEVYEKKTNTTDPAGYADLIAFIEALNRTPEHRFASWFDETLATDRFTDFLAVNTIVANYDLIDGNQYLYHDVSRDRWHHIPWDYNNGTFSEPYVSPLVLTFYENGPFNPWWLSSLTRYFANPTLRARFLSRLGELMRGELDGNAVAEAARSAVHQASQDVLLDPWMIAWERDTAFVDDVTPAINAFVEARYAFLREILPTLETTAGPLVVNELQTRNTGQAFDESEEAEPWIELFHRGGEPMTLQGVCLMPNLREPDAAHCFEEPIGIDPGQALVLWADGQKEQGELHLGFVLEPEVTELGLYRCTESDEGDGETCRIFDIVVFDNPPEGQSYGRLENGADQWGDIATPTPGN